MNKQNSAKFLKNGSILICAKTLATDSFQRPKAKVSAKKCVCRFLWKNELHGLSAFLEARTVFARRFWASVIALCMLASVTTAFYTFEHYFERHTITYNSIKRPPQGVKMPVIVVCPKNPDALNFSKVLSDIGQRFAPDALNRRIIKQLIRFAVAGAGFGNVEGFEAQRSERPGDFVALEQLDALFHHWLGNRTLKEFYKSLFEDWGYKCHELIQRCYLGSKLIRNCCSFFEPYFVMLRGRCMRMNETLYQKDPADFGRFDVYMNQLRSPLSDMTPKMQPQMVVYLTDTDRNVGLFPRYYINFGAAVSLRGYAREIKMLADGNSQCQKYQTEEQGRNTCRLKQWLREKVISQYNCTLFYLDFDNGTICDPRIIVENYEKITDLRVDSGQRCLPACKRNETIFNEYALKGSILNQHNYHPPFRMEVYFNDLQVDIYKEEPTLTVVGFIVQLGGQLGLYLGLSIGSFVQIILTAMRKFHQWMELRMEKRRANAKRRKEIKEIGAMTKRKNSPRRNRSSQPMERNVRRDNGQKGKGQRIFVAMELSYLKNANNIQH